MNSFKTYSKDGFSIDLPDKFRIKKEFPNLYAKAHGSFSSVVVEEILNRENLESLLRIPVPISNIQNEIKVQKFDSTNDPLIGRSIYFSQLTKVPNIISYHYVLHGETKSKKMYSILLLLDGKYSMETLQNIVASIKFEVNPTSQP